MKKSPPELVVISQLFYPELVSTGQTLTELCEALSEKGIAITVWCAKPSIQKQQVSSEMYHRGIKIKRLWSTGFEKTNFFGKLCNHISFSFSVFTKLLGTPPKVPILCLTNPPFLAFVIACAGYFRRFRLIYLVFDVYPDTGIAMGLLRPNGILSKLWRGANRLVYRHSESIIVIGRCMRDVILNILPQQDQHKCRHIHVWADDKHIQSQLPSPNPYLKKWQLDGKFVVLYSGNMGRFHELKTFIDTAERLQGFPKIMFLFVGGGHQKSWLEQTITNRHLHNVQVHDYVPREALPLALNCAHVGLVSLDAKQTGFSVPSKTYGLFAAGLPVIAVMDPKAEIALTIQETTSGAVFQTGQSREIAETLKQWASDSSMYNHLKQNALMASKTYSLEKAANAYYSLILSLQ